MSAHVRWRRLWFPTRGGQCDQCPLLHRHSERNNTPLVLLPSDWVRCSPIPRMILKIDHVCYSHCEQGMVFAINPTANKSFAAFQSAAKASSADGTPASTSNTTTGTGSGSGSGSGSSTSSAPTSSSSSKSNGAVTAGARAGGLLAMVGFAAGILL
jgi:hypothetical protein